MRKDGISASAIACALVCLTCGAFGQLSIRTPDLSGFQNFVPNEEELTTGPALPGQGIPEQEIPEQSTASPINSPVSPFQGQAFRGATIAHLGPFSGAASAAVGYAFNDNASTTETDKLSLNEIFENLSLDLLWPLSPFNSINVQLGGQLQENFYSNGKNALNVVILPGSQILLQAKAGEFLVRAYERLTVTQDPVSDPGLAGETNINQLTNTVGVGVVWPLYKVDVSLNLDYTYSDTFGSTVSTLTTTGTGGSVLNSFHVGSRVAFEITPRLSWGPEINATYNAGGGGDDFDVFSVGGFFRGHLTELIAVDAGIGVLLLGGPAGGPPGYYAYLSIRHELTRTLQIIAGVNHDSEFSVGLGVTQNNNVHLTAEARLTRQWALTVGPDVNFGTVITGVLPGRYTQYGFTADSTFRLNRRWIADINYRFAKRDGSEVGGSYTQNLLTVTFSYGF
jgi:hypothetical protein